MKTSTRREKKGKYTDVLLKRLGMDQPPSPEQKKLWQQEREEYIQSLHSEGKGNSTKRTRPGGVYGRQPSKTTLQIFGYLINQMITDPFNRQDAEGMKHPPESSKQTTNVRERSVKKSHLRRIK